MIEVMWLAFLLRQWKEEPDLPLGEYRCMAGWRDDPAERYRRPISAAHLARAKARFRRIAPTHFREMFPEE
jgi:hypothetical protein